MAICKLSADQYAAQASNTAGIFFEYAGKDNKNSAVHFFGPDFTPAEKTQDAMFYAIKEVVKKHWENKTEETRLREANDGIRSKLRATTPARIIIRTASGETVRNFDLSASEWARIGVVPTKKDIERSASDKKRYIHNATIAMMEALGLRNLPKFAEESAETPAEQPAATKTTKPATGKSATAAQSAA